tara:strand:- start:1032 stop:1910 length:879 start_codon:yes stop_codon:yes gene_type:complete
MSLKDYVDKYSVEPDFRVSEFNFQTKRTSANAYIPAFIISDINNSVSTAGARNVLNSINATKSKLHPVIMPATTPETLSAHLKLFDVTKNDWTYPSKGEKRIDLKTGLHITGYGANDIEKVISCMVSHMRCWLVAATYRHPCVILEHDAIFVKKLDFYEKASEENGGRSLDQVGSGIIGLNNPKGATRKSSVYYDSVSESVSKSTPQQKTYGRHQVVDAPWVDDNRDAPQGLAGNSAYIITPDMARSLFTKCAEIGIWPNDALMCKQIFPFKLKQIYPFVTELQGVKSTTQG